MRWITLLALAACSATSRPTPIEAPRDQIKIPHSVHAAAKVKCIACHEGVYDETAIGTSTTALPAEDTCLQCHKEQKEKNNCGFCHTDVQHAAKPTIAEGTVKMNHTKHIDLVKEDCTTCHKQLPEPFVNETAVPKMADCLTCHGHSEEYAQTQCTGCHPTLNKLALKPLSDFSHQGNYVARHGADARSSATNCSQCHDQTYCADCHAKTVATRIEVKFPEEVDRQFIHRNDFLARHSIEAAGNDATCRRCHGNSFCQSCHEAQNLTTTAANPRDPHPLGWTIPGSAEFHGDAARRDIASCASCHDQGPKSNCVGCHRVGGSGGNPHPASWLSHHDHNEIRSNGMCTTCHI
jgi:cytochrome c7-like protein